MYWTRLAKCIHKIMIRCLNPSNRSINWVANSFKDIGVFSVSWWKKPRVRHTLTNICNAVKNLLFISLVLIFDPTCMDSSWRLCHSITDFRILPNCKEKYKCISQLQRNDSLFIIEILVRPITVRWPSINCLLFSLTPWHPRVKSLR